MSFAPSFQSDRTSQPAFSEAVDGVNKREGKPRPYSLRLTWEERDQLKIAAGKQSWAAYIRSRLFADQVSKRRKNRVTNSDTQAIARLAALLGKSRIPNNLNQLAKASNTGCLVIDEETKAQLNEACANIAHIRKTLMVALDIREN